MTTGSILMECKATPLAGVVVLKPKIFGDERGFFLETWNERVLADVGINAKFVQDNHSRSRQGILRGMHYQTEHTQGKLVRVSAGEVFDVVVDVRVDSTTLGQWFGITLTASGQEQLWIPPGFAHGFYVLSDSADFQYKCTDYYHPESEVSLAWDDPSIAIDWPLVNSGAPDLSNKDMAGKAFADIPLIRA